MFVFHFEDIALEKIVFFKKQIFNHLVCATKKRQMGFRVGTDKHRHRFDMCTGTFAKGVAALKLFFNSVTSQITVGRFTSS